MLQKLVYIYSFFLSSQFSNFYVFNLFLKLFLDEPATRLLWYEFDVLIGHNILSRTWQV